MLKKATVVLLTMILIISTLSAVSFTASAANNSRQLMVSGNQLVFADEPTTTVRLTGVNVPGGEWTGTPSVEKIDRSVTWAIDNWDCNIIRLPVSINGWTGNYSYVSDGGKSFKNYIDSVISIASERGAYVILDLHHYTSFNKEDYITFWQEAAVRYMNNPTVLFGILNEPHSTTWDVWRNGDGSSVYGHQYVVEMIRDLGAKNIIVAGGLDWAYNVSGVVDGYALIDQGTNNNTSKAGYGIMYDTHIYPWKGHTSNWDSKVGAVRKLYPILVGECGWDIGTINEIAGKDPQPGDALYHDMWVPELLAWMDDDTTYGAKANYTGYCMHPSSAPQLVTSTDANGYGWKDANYSYTPTDYWGVYLVPHLEAAVATRYGTIDSVKATAINVVNPKTTYNVGDAFDKSTGYINVEYSDGTTAQVNLSDSGVTVTGFDSSAASESQIITVAYGGKTATYTVVINDPNANLVAKTYLDIDFEDAAYQVVDGADNYAVIQTTNKATGNKIDINFYNSSDTNRYQVYTADGSTYVATKGRKTNSAFDFRPEVSVTDKNNLVYVEARVKRVSYNVDDPVSIVFTDDSANPIFRLNYVQNAAPVLVADATYDTVTYPVNGDWTYIRAIIDFGTSTFELYQGTDLNSLTAMVTGTKTFGFESSSATNLTRITNYGIGNRKGSLAFDDIKIYTVGEDEGGEDTTPVTLSSISVSGEKTAYAVGDAFVAPTVIAAYSDGTTKTVTGAAFSGYNMSAAGTQTVTVSYGGKTTTYSINVAAPEKVVASISVSNPITQYVWGDEFIEPTVIATYTNSYYADEIVTGATFNNYSMTEVRTHTVRVIYGGKATTYSITVSAPSKVISSIEVTDAKTEYTVGEAFVVPSVTVKYTSAYYPSQLVTPTCTGYNMSQTGTQTVTASYGGKTTTYQITVTNPVATLESISVSGEKTAYNVGDAFVAPTVTAFYSDGTSKTVTGASFTGYNMSTAGTQTVTVTYEGRTTTYQITVTNVPEPDVEFTLEVGCINEKVGTAQVEVPLNITKMFENQTIGCLSVNILYDTEKFSYNSVTMGPMVERPASDTDIAELEPGKIVICFTSDGTAPITSAGIAANNLFATVKLDVKDTTAAFTSAIGIEAAAKLTDKDAVTLIKKTALADCLKAGYVEISAAAAPGYDVTVATDKHIGFDYEGVDVYYIKSLVLSEGNGEYIVKVGDYELYWSPERQCYVGVTAPENYNKADNTCFNVSVTSGNPPTIKKYCDVTGDGYINMSDISALRAYLEHGTALPVRYAGDANIDGYLNLTDFSVIRNLIEYNTSLF